MRSKAARAQACHEFEGGVAVPGIGVHTPGTHVAMWNALPDLPTVERLAPSSVGKILRDRRVGDRTQTLRGHFAEPRFFEPSLMYLTTNDINWISSKQLWYLGGRADMREDKLERLAANYVYSG